MRDKKPTERTQKTFSESVAVIGGKLYQEGAENIKIWGKKTQKKTQKGTTKTEEWEISILPGHEEKDILKWFIDLILKIFKMFY